MCINSTQRSQCAPISNKAEAMQFAVIATMKKGIGKPHRVDYDEAKKLYDFICQNVTFPDDERTAAIKELFGTLANCTVHPSQEEALAARMAETMGGAGCEAGVQTVEESPLMGAKFKRHKSKP